jgi:hypothetical protein
VERIPNRDHAPEKHRHPHPDAAGAVIHRQIATSAILAPYNRLI